jgi:glycine/D-amino acid oxidase-like deaminating enzyme
MGFGGNGITFSKIAADLISSEILGHRDADWDLFPIH